MIEGPAPYFFFTYVKKDGSSQTKIDFSLSSPKYIGEASSVRSRIIEKNLLYTDIKEKHNLFSQFYLI